jgi:hypothetical protein
MGTTHHAMENKVKQHNSITITNQQRTVQSGATCKHEDEYTVLLQTTTIGIDNFMLKIKVFINKTNK